MSFGRKFDVAENGENISFTQKVSSKGYYDVAVAGGGVAGISAAIAAARRGKKVLLIEKSNILGGLATLGLINYFVPMCNGRGKQIIFGLAEELLRESVLYGFNTIPEGWENGEPDEPPKRRYTTRYSPYIFAFQLVEKVKKEGIDLLLDCIATDPVMKGDSCEGVLVYGKGGVDYYRCRTLIDTTGDADILRAVGIPTASRGNFFTYGCNMITLENCREAAESGDIRKAFKGIGGGGINLFGDKQPEDIPMWKGLTVEEVTDYLVRNQTLALNKIKEKSKKGIDYEITTVPHMPQFRTTACMKGDFTLKATDVYKHREDSICAINDFEHRDHLWEVPIGAITRHDTPNILTAGRCASGEGYGWDILRVIPPAIITGQAAGEIASMAVEDGCGVADVNVRELQKRLESDNVMVHFPDSLVPEKRTLVIHGRDYSSEAEMCNSVAESTDSGVTGEPIHI